jgi:hypothetical protein
VIAAAAAVNAEEPPPPSVTFASGGISWTRVSTPRLLSRIAKVLYGVSALSALAIAYRDVGWFAIFGLIGLFAWPLFIVSYIVSLTQTTFAGGLAVSRTELVVHGPGSKRTFIPIAKVVGALVVHREVFSALVPTVEIELANGDLLTARCPDPRSADAIVTALGFGAGGKRVHASLATPTRRLLNPLVGFVSYMASMVALLAPLSLVQGGTGYELAYALYPPVALLLYAGAKRLLRAPEVTVGEDGILLKRRLRSTFVPRSDIAFVSAAGSVLVVERRDGARIAMSGIALDLARRQAVARIVEERSGPQATTADRFAHYESGGRVLAEWRAHLARAMNQESYRQHAATVDEATAVLHSAHATPEQRVGAALALRVAGQPKERIRVAVDAAADERVRAALDAVAEADDPVIEKALQRLKAP